MKFSDTEERKHKMTQWLNEFAVSGIEVNLNYLIVVLSFAVISLLIVTRYLSVKYSTLKKQLNQLQNEVRAINSGNLGMGRKMSQFAEEIANVELGNISQDASVANDKTYQQAGLLLSRGATIEEVVESCEIAPAEAELLAIMRHSQTDRPALA